MSKSLDAFSHEYLGNGKDQFDSYKDFRINEAEVGLQILLSQRHEDVSIEDIDYYLAA